VRARSCWNPTAWLALALAVAACEGDSSLAPISWSGSLTATSTRLDKLYADDPRFELQFSEVELIGDELLVGAPGSPGAVYVYRRAQGGWEKTQKLIPDPAPFGLRFGSSVSATGDLLAVGAPARNNEIGSVFIYRRTPAGWTFQQRLVGPAAESGNYFANDVVAADGWVAAGSGYNPDQRRPGSVQLYRWADGSWVADQRLQASNSRTSDQFGMDAAIEGDTLAVGAPASFVYPGSVYVFQRTGGVWTERQILTESSDQDSFGWSVDLQGDLMVVGAPRPSSYGVGAVHVYGRSGDLWQRRQTLNVPTIAGRVPPFGFLGYGVARVGDTLLASDVQRLFLWKLINGQWIEHAWLAPESGTDSDSWAGAEVSMSPTAIVSGNRSSNARANEAGVVHYSFAHPITVPQTPDAGADATPDAGADATPDAAPDMGVDRAPDLSLDLNPDAAPGADTSSDEGARDGARADSTDVADLAPVADAGSDRDAGDSGEEPACTCRLGARPSGPAPAPAGLLLVALLIGRLGRRRLPRP
jgi:hypothetical protein